MVERQTSTALQRLVVPRQNKDAGTGTIVDAMQSGSRSSLRRRLSQMGSTMPASCRERRLTRISCSAIPQSSSARFVASMSLEHLQCSLAAPISSVAIALIAGPRFVLFSNLGHKRQEKLIMVSALCLAQPAKRCWMYLGIWMNFAKILRKASTWYFGGCSVP